MLPRELIWSEELKTWLSPALMGDQRMPEGAPLPSKVLDWVKQKTQAALRESAPRSGTFRKQYFNAPWIPVPHFVKTMIPKGIDQAAGEAEILGYTFQNNMLMIEALTHASATDANSPPNQRLTLIGAAVVELI